MPLEGELVNKSLEERRSRDEYRELAAKLRAQGYLSEGNLVDAIADDENKHSSVLMTLVGSIEGKKGVDEAARREEEGPFHWNITDQDTLKVSKSPTGYRRVIDAEEGARSFIVSDLDPVGGKYKVEVFDRYGNVVKTFLPVPYGPPEERPFPKTYGDWVSLAEDIKTKYPDDPVMRASVNHQLHQIMRETEEVPGEGEERVRAAQEARRWMTEKAGELGIK